MDVQVLSLDPGEVSWRARVLDYRVLDYPTVPRGTEAVETLICTVEELLHGLTTAADSDLGRLRARATDALAAAKAAVALNVTLAFAQNDPVATGHLDGWVRKWPTAAVAAAAMLGVAIGLSASWVHRRPRRSRRRRRSISPAQAHFALL